MSADFSSPDLWPPVAEAADHARGTAAALVTVVEFGDYECPYSRAAYRSIQLSLREFGEDLRFVFRHFPLQSVHPHAMDAALAAEAAAAAGGFWTMHDLLFRHQDALELDDLRAYARSASIEEGAFLAAMASEAAAEKVRRDVASGARSGVRGTPGLFIDGHRYEQSYRHQELRAAIAERAHAARRQGGKATGS